MEKLLEELNEKFKQLSDNVKKTAEEAGKEAKQAGELSQETRAKTDEALRKYNDVVTALDGIKKKLEGVTTTQTELAQQVAEAQRGGPGKPRSLGAEVTEHEAYKSFVANGARGTSRIPVESSRFRQAITSVTGSAGGLIWPQQERDIVGLPMRQMTIRDLLPQGTTNTNAIQYARQVLRDNQAAPVSEGVEKPESNYGWEQTSTTVKTIAHWVPVSRQAMDDAAQLQGLIDTELRYGLDLVEEAQLLNGDGTGENLEGLVTAATAYSAEFAPTAEQHIDVLRLAILQVALQEYAADGIVLHPTDWAFIELLKDGENRYLWSAPRGGLGTPTMWGLPVVPTQSMEEDKFLVGAFRMAAMIWDRMAAEVLVSSEDRDNFIKNMLTVRAEKRLAFTVKRPLSLSYGDFGRVG